MMRLPTFRTAAIALAASVGLGGCAYGSLGVGAGYGGGYGTYGYGYDPYYGGYGGYGSYGYGSPYGGYGYGYGSPYSGWYGDYYYPGTGYYVYDRDRHQHRWSDSQRQYWENRRQQATTHGSTSTAPTSPDWRGFNRPSGSSSSTDWQARRQAWQQQHSQQTQQQQSLQTQQADRVHVRSDDSQSSTGRSTPRHPRDNSNPRPQ